MCGCMRNVYFFPCLCCGLRLSLFDWVKGCPWLTGLKAVPGREKESADTLLVSVSGLNVLDRYAGCHAGLG